MLGRWRFLAIAAISLCAFAAPAHASPGAYRVLIVHTNELPPAVLAKQIAAFPDVASVDIVNAGTRRGHGNPDRRWARAL